MFRVFRGAKPIRFIGSAEPSLTSVCSVCSVVPNRFAKTVVTEPIAGNLPPDRFRQQGDIPKGSLSQDLQAEDFVEILAQGRIEPIVDRVFCRD